MNWADDIPEPDPIKEEKPKKKYRRPPLKGWNASFVDLFSKVHWEAELPGLGMEHLLDTIQAKPGNLFSTLFMNGCF
jgi:hypothetical protein